MSHASTSRYDIPGGPPAPAEGRPANSFITSAGPALFSGATQAVLFNPFDRALYVRVRYRREHFLDRRNFERPFQGFLNAAVYRTLVGASYMFWQDSARVFISTQLPSYCQQGVAPQLHSFLVGLFAGTLNGLALNNLQSVKFNMWNSDKSGETFLGTAMRMYHEGGVRVFFRGCMITVARDAVFGVVYESARHATGLRGLLDRCVMWGEQRNFRLLWPISTAAVECTNGCTGEEHTIIAAEPHPNHHGKCSACSFVSNLVAALLASVASSPINYLRSLAYGTPPGSRHIGYLSLTRSLFIQVKYIYYNGESFMNVRDASSIVNPSYSGAGAPPAVPQPGSGASSPAAASPLASASPRLDSGPAASSKRTCSPPHAKRPAPPAVAEQHSVKITGSGAAAHNPGLKPNVGPEAKPSCSSSRIWQFLHQRNLAKAQRREARRRTAATHPLEAWRWINSRLNIGWGSLRVGLGMAIGQSLFHFSQDYLVHIMQSRVPSSQSSTGM